MRAVRQRTGLARVFGILSHGGGQLLHRGGGFLQMGSLAFGTLGQIIVATGDLTGGQRNRAGALLDPFDHRGQLLRRRIGIALHGLERPVEVAPHALVQIAIGQCREHAADLTDRATHAVQQLIDAAGQAVEEARASVRGLQPAIKIALAGGLDDIGHGMFQQQFVGAVMPFHREALALALRIEYRRDNLGEVHRADPHTPVMGDHQRIEDGADAVRIGMETVDAAADQALGVEVGEGLTQAGLLVAQQAHHRLVHVADHVVVVGDHHCGAGDIQCLPDLGIVRMFDTVARLRAGCLRGQRDRPHLCLPQRLALLPHAQCHHAQQQRRDCHRKQRPRLPLPDRGGYRGGKQHPGRDQIGGIRGRPGRARAQQIGWAGGGIGHGGHEGSRISRKRKARGVIARRRMPHPSPAKRWVQQRKEAGGHAQSRCRQVPCRRWRSPPAWPGPVGDGTANPALRRRSLEAWVMRGFATAEQATTVRPTKIGLHHRYRSLPG